MDIPKRLLGRTGQDVTIIGLGGEGVLRTFGRETEAYRLINRALDLGINYCESARAYSGSESYYGLALKERRQEIFLTSKSHARDKKGALAHLHETLRNMDTGHLDLWQVHDVRTEDEIEEIFGGGGAIEAFAEAKERGLARFIGVTGHHDPRIIRRCIELFDFDTVLLPVNPAEPHYRSFIEEVIPLAVERGMGVIAMKVYFRGMAAQIAPGKLDLFYRYALSHPVTTAVIGCDTIGQLEENVRFASAFTALTEDEMALLSERLSRAARKLMYYKP
ncbi:MAG: aldo/keto reductase [Nitrospirae bacterium]|nr:aldo/keto reductase [Nitrospirota bacterium]